MEKDYQLEKIHELELKIAVEIKRICEKNNIPYFLTAGTLLGAVRHGGFIPWDDDMDIGMLRDDYEKFLIACQTDLGDEFFLQTWDTDPEYPFSFGKVRLNGTCFIEGFSKAGKMHNGIFVDIFPFDNVPDNDKERMWQARCYYICKRLLWIKKGFGQNIKEESKRQAFRFYLFWLFSKFFKYERIKSDYKKIQCRYNGKKTELVVTDGSYKYSKESIKRVWVDNLENIPFEGELFTSYVNKVDYLTYFYGNYMELPPIEKRNRHKRIRVDFGPYT